MKRFTSAVCVVAIVAACQTPDTRSPGAEPTPAPAAAEPSPEATDAAKASDETEDPSNSHGLKLSKAREAIARLDQSQTRGDVERALGQPDRTDFTDLAGALTETAGGGVLWTYEWTLPSGERTRFLIGFGSDAPGARVTHSYWLRDSSPGDRPAPPAP